MSGYRRESRGQTTLGDCGRCVPAGFVGRALRFLLVAPHDRTQSLRLLGC